MQHKASAPGSVMVLGEYAVIEGGLALVAAIDKRVQVILTPRNDDKIEIYSPTLGMYTSTISQLRIEPPYEFVLGVLKHFQLQLAHGFSIETQADFSHQVGLGSSAAITAAMLCALTQALSIDMPLIELVEHGIQVIRTVQGRGSGADVATSVFGGLVAFCNQPLMVEKLSALCPISLLYAGFKTTTVDAIRQVQQRFKYMPTIYRRLMQGINECGKLGIQVAREEDWQALGKIMSIQQGLMVALGVNLPIMDDLIEYLIQQPNMVGAKISGSGLGDCVIGLGASLHNGLQLTQSGASQISVNMASQGVVYEKS